MSWSTAPDLKAQVMRLWERGELLREGLDAATSRFPLRLSLKTPSPDDITRRFDAVRAWVAAISSARRGGSIAPQAITPKPPALLIAETRLRSETQLIAPHRIAYSLPKNSLPRAIRRLVLGKLLISRA